MAESKKHCIKVQGTLVEVTEEVYLDYYRARRRWSAQAERNTYNGLVSYNAMDTDETLGEEMIPDLEAPSVEDVVLGRLRLEKLRLCLPMLTKKEWLLVHALYYEQKTEREYAEILGISQKAVNKRRHKVLDKLRRLMKV